ncbi:MAG: M15 family metallopeptidase [Candidatus Micrarchaeaceae archaeon]
MITYIDCIKRYGNPFESIEARIRFERRWMQIISVDEELSRHFPALPMKLYINSDMYFPLMSALANLIQEGIGEELREYNGIFNIRKQRGYSKPSLHSWGVAIDINASQNPLGRAPRMSEKFVQCFEQAGFDWGGKWKRPDGMHFQLSRLP